MSLALLESFPKPRLRALLDHFGQIDDPREPRRVAHPLPEVLLRATFADWVGKSAALVRPLIGAIEGHVMAARLTVTGSCRCWSARRRVRGGAVSGGGGRGLASRDARHGIRYNVGRS